MPRMRFRLRTLLVGITAFAVVLGLMLSWWTRPSVLTGSYPNGQRAWEQWERRTPACTIEHVATKRWYPDGTLAYEFYVSPNTLPIYYSPNGGAIDDPREWSIKYGNLIADAEESPDSVRPYKQFIWWWNEW